ncbi:MAG TPA: hypothetical protein VLO09_08420 [Ornithinimicrobium sp.]|nr:hypothetical protein [Ornithinimicrobium sp.]
MVDHQLDPRDYPWTEQARVGVLHRGGFREGARGEEVGGRTPVVAVGSNAAATVLAAKLGGLLAAGVPMGTATVDGLHIGHSAHVSARGYVAAAPARGARVQPVTVCWFDPAQLQELDATEPNYRRVLLPPGMPCRLVGGTHRSAGPAGGRRVQGAQIYESVHGVLADGGTALTLRAQSAVLRWLAARLPRDLRSSLTHAQLVDPDVRERVRRAVLDAGLSMPSGLTHPGPCSGRVRRRPGPA